MRTPGQGLGWRGPVSQHPVFQKEAEAWVGWQLPTVRTTCRWAVPARAHPHFKRSLTCTARDTISNFNTVCPHGNVTFKKTQFGHFYSLV